MTLRTRPLGGSGLHVSEIGLGAWQLGAYREWDGPDEEESGRIVDEALERGCTFFDTASPYADGRSEEFLGRALVGRRAQAAVCTKFGFWAPGYQRDHSADRIEEAVELSLSRLRTDYLDVLLIHGADEFLDGTKVPHYTILQRLQDAGTIRAYGVEMGSRLTSEGLRTLAETTGVTCAELRFNALYQESGALFEQAAAAGIGLIGSVPLEMGWLSGKYDANSRFAGSRSRWSSEEIARVGARVQAFQNLLPEGVSISHAALRYVLAHAEISTVIPGARSVSQLRNNLAAAAGTLPPQTLDAIREFGRVEVIST